MTSPVLDTAASELSVLTVRSVTDVAGLTDSDLVALNRLDAQLMQRAQTRLALSAGEIARRSADADGLAQRAGYRTPVELVRATTGASARDVSTAVRVGSLATDSHPVSIALLDGSLSVPAADAIRTGLGAATIDIPESVLADAAAVLCEEAGTLDADRLLRRAREIRDELDASGVADREAARRAARSLKFVKLPDGMARLSWTMDPETAAVVGDVYDRATSPRRGGPRFVDSPLATSITDDDRTTDQLASDVFTEVLRQGADADSTRLLGSGAPVVSVVVTREAREAGAGAAWIEGQSAAVSIATVARLECSGAVVDITVDGSGAVLDLGREQRFYNRRQRTALAIRDGGCRWPGCDRPPSWTEAHHIETWA